MAMARKARGVLSVFVLAMAITLMLGGICGGGLQPEKAAACDKFLVIVVLFVASALIVIGLCFPIPPAKGAARGIIVLYAIFYLLLMLLMAFAIFGLVVTDVQKSSHEVGRKGYKEFKLGNYTTWMRSRVRDPGSWAAIKSCLVKRDECRKLYSQQPDWDTNVIMLNGLQSGCCKPPDVCGFDEISRTRSIYDKPDDDSAIFPGDKDCMRFVNDEEKCYNCDSCRAAFSDTLSRSWRTMSTINIVVAILLFIAGSFELVCFEGEVWGSKF